MLAQRVSAGTRTLQDTSAGGATDIPKSTLAKLLFGAMHRARIPTASPNTSSFPKNNSLPPHSAYNKPMRTGDHHILPRLGSLLIVLCLLAAPLCATRCAISSCAQPNAPEQSTTGCHHPSNHSRNSSAHAAAIAPTCLPADSLLTTLPAPQSRLLSAGTDSHWLSAILNAPSISETSITIAFRGSNRSSSPADSASFLSNPPLRL
jgi:hypothetical protein